MTLPGFAHSARVAQSRCLFHWRSRDGALAPVTGQVPTFVRAAGLSGQSDYHGNSFAVGYAAPGWTRADLDDDGIYETIALRASTAAGYVSWPLPVRPSLALTAYVKWIDQRPGSEGARLFDLVWATPLGEFMVGHTGTQAYFASFYDGTTTRTSQTGSIGGAGAVVEACATLAANGVVQIATTIDNGPIATIAASASLTRPTSTGGAVLYTGAPGFQATADLGVIKMAAGLLTLDVMRELL